MLDRDTGLVHLGAREYDPATGRFTSVDPLSFGGGDTNLYGYVAADPMNAIDPNGMLELPADPFSLPAPWTYDPTHQDELGYRFRHPSGDYLDHHVAKPWRKGWGKRDHWHRNGKRKHLAPGDTVPDPAEVCVDDAQSQPDAEEEEDEEEDDGASGFIPYVLYPLLSATLPGFSASPTLNGSGARLPGFGTGVERLLDGLLRQFPALKPFYFLPESSLDTSYSL